MKRDIGTILEMFVLAGLDIVQRFVDRSENRDEVDVVAVNLWALHRITNDALADCSKMWGRKAPMLTMKWKWSLPYSRR